MADEVANRMSESDSRVATWNDEDSFWRESFSSRPYAKADRGYDYYRPAYQYGFESATQHRGREWSDVESDLSQGWGTARGQSQSTWEDVKDAVRDAWNRVAGGAGGGTERGAKREMSERMNPDASATRDML